MRVRAGLVLLALAATLAVVAMVVVQNVAARREGGTAAADLTARQLGGVGGAWHDYLPAAFAKDLATHKTVLVAVHADWCTDCAVQAPILGRLLQDPKFSGAAAYVVNFDKERTFLRAHRVRQQSTLIVFRDGVEVARSVADTNEARIRALFEQGL